MPPDLWKRFTCVIRGLNFLAAPALECSEPGFAPSWMPLACPWWVWSK